ncbi:hypothetical protein [Sphingomonas molluscorum]
MGQRDRNARFGSLLNGYASHISRRPATPLALSAKPRAFFLNRAHS